MQTKLLNDIVGEIIGQHSPGVLEILEGKKDVNEFFIARKMKLTINQVRNIFYKMSNFGLVSFTRKKDKRKGWYTYFWTLNTEKSLELLNKRIEKEIENLNHQLKNRETKRFYFCETCKTEVNEEHALLHDFICQECGIVYKLNEDKKVIENLQHKIERLGKQKADVAQELISIRDSIKKTRDRKGKRDEKKKAEEKRKKREKKARERKKEKKKQAQKGNKKKK